MDNLDGHVGGYRIPGRVETDVIYKAENREQNKEEAYLPGMAKMIFVPGYGLKLWYDDRKRGRSYNIGGPLTLDLMKVIFYADIAILVNDLINHFQ